jgi:hypothetical protein
MMEKWIPIFLIEISDELKEQMGDMPIHNE